MDFSQLENYKEGYRPPVLFPCVLIDFSEWNFDDESKNMQTGEGVIMFRLAHAP